MASESTDGESVTVVLPADLDDWLDDRAAQLDVDREAVLVQLLSSYRTTAELDGDLASDSLAVPVADAETVADVVERELETQLQSAVESAVTDHVSEATDAVRQQLEGRLDTVEEDYREKLDDVRERVIQVKKEVDGKAPVGHSHEELARLEEVAARLADIEESVEELGSSVAEHDVVVEDVDERLDEVQDRLQTVAWVVNDLREADDSEGIEAVERIKRAAAKADIDRAKCENCGNGVNIALLSDPECPHCQATVTNVDPANGFFSKPRLQVASQLESGENR